ncbi:MAG: hypothetical protein JSR25_15210 [Proteobacteria bacterium]|nr:hypothetical protein [Pseudomonadota bacterium]
MAKDKTSLYLTALTLLVAAVLGGIGLLNYLVDPLWFFGGNKLQPRNFSWDERIARLARFSASDRDYDCYIFGASRVGLMSEHAIKGHSCFMISFENGSPRELIAYAQYIKHNAKREPDLVVVGVDDFDFIDQADANNVPPDVLRNRTPHFWDYYFSWDVATWSIKTLFDQSPKARYFGKDLTGQIRADAGTMPVLHMTLKPGQKWHMSLNSVGQYAKFREIFPKAHLVAYATPVAADKIAQFKEMGLLPFYLQALQKTSAQFDEMYDFSIPSQVTSDPKLTYDGSHYQPAVSDRIAAAIQNHEPSFGIVLSGRTQEEITRLYADRLELYAPQGISRAE